MRGGGLYAHLSEARMLDQYHIALHHEANRLMDVYKAGRKEDAAAGFEPAQVIASKMIVLLETMEAKMRTGA